VPTVTRINVAPVKALGLVHPDEALLEQTGVAENRRFHLVDERGRRYNQIRNGRLVQVRPEYDADAERLTLRFPDGAPADGTVAVGEEITVDFYGRPVRGRLVEGLGRRSSRASPDGRFGSSGRSRAPPSTAAVGRSRSCRRSRWPSSRAAPAATTSTDGASACSFRSRAASHTRRTAG
jgi:hypothetical protein